MPDLTLFSHEHFGHFISHFFRKDTNRYLISNTEIVNTKGRFGDWEIDTVVSENNKGAIVTMVERKTAFMMMEKLKHGKMPNNGLKLSSECSLHTANRFIPLPVITVLNLLTMKLLLKPLKLNSFLRIPTPPGKSDLLKIQINLSDSTSLKKQILTNLIINKSNRYNIKSTTGPEKN
jgi:hypothetical protein